MLRFRLQIDEEIATANEVDVGKGRVRQNIVNREHDAVAQFARHSVMVIFPGEKSRQPVRRNVRFDRVWIEPVAGESHGVRVDVRRENLNPRWPLQLLKRLEKQHGERIRLFPGAAPRTPDADRQRVLLPIDEVGDDFVRKEVEGRAATEKLRDADQQILAQQLGLRGFFAQKLQI